MSVVEELQRLRRVAEVNAAQLQKLQHELRLLDISAGAKQQANRQHTARTQEEISKLEASIATLSEFCSPSTLSVGVKCAPSATSSEALLSDLSKHRVHKPSPALHQERVSAAVQDLERQVEQLTLLRCYRRKLEDVLRYGVAHHQQYNIMGLFDSKNEMDRVALARIMSSV